MRQSKTKVGQKLSDTDTLFIWKLITQSVVCHDHLAVKCEMVLRLDYDSRFIVTQGLKLLIKD